MPVCQLLLECSCGSSSPRFRGTLNSSPSRAQTLLDCPLPLSSLLEEGVSGSDDDRLEILF